jgi:hypothetical protein
MNKQPDFGNDLATLDENVNAAVGDVLHALHQKRTTRSSEILKKSEETTVKQTVSADQTAEESEKLAVAGAPRRQRSTARTQLAAVIEREEVWKSVTTRLRLETIEMLKDACLRQELKRKSPHTGQGIIDEALGDWFRKHGYGRTRDSAADT